MKLEIINGVYLCFMGVFSFLSQTKHDDIFYQFLESVHRHDLIAGCDDSKRIIVIAAILAPYGSYGVKLKINFLTFSYS